MLLWKITFTGSKYPNNIQSNFEKRLSLAYHITLSVNLFQSTQTSRWTLSTISPKNRYCLSSIILLLLLLLLCTLLQYIWPWNLGEAWSVHLSERFCRVGCQQDIQSIGVDEVWKMHQVRLHVYVPMNAQILKRLGKMNPVEQLRECCAPSLACWAEWQK